MDIGNPQRVITVEPATIPVPQRETAPATPAEPRRPARKEPATPQKDPVKVPEKS
jgi:hypothetical protein